MRSEFYDNENEAYLLNEKGMARIQLLLDDINFVFTEAKYP